jgi:hypothetical protein
MTLLGFTEMKGAQDDRHPKDDLLAWVSLFLLAI